MSFLLVRCRAESQTPLAQNTALETIEANLSLGEFLISKSLDLSTFLIW